MAHDPSTVYRKLNAAESEIRLLVLKVGNRKGIVQCDVRHICLTNRPLVAYETISYVWGDASVRGTILLDGQGFDVPASSEAVLRRMRLPKQNRLIWIDAICINERNIEERSQQVAMMADIYGNTAKNLIWLGEPAGYWDTREAMRALVEIMLNVNARTANGERFLETIVDVDTGQYRHVSSDEPGLRCSVSLAPLLRLYQSRWFTRLWVVQEAALAPTSVCHYGDEQESLTNVLRVAAWLMYHEIVQSNGVDAAIGVRNASLMWAYADSDQRAWLKIKGYETPLSKCLNDMQDFDAHDPRDHVYGLLGIFMRRLPPTTPLPELLTPDYTRRAAEVLRNAAIYALYEEEDLRSLNHVELPNRKARVGDDPPSWVPRWDRPRKDGVRPVPFRSAFQGCGPHSTTAVRERLSRVQWRNLNVLCVKGCVAAPVDKVWLGLDRKRSVKDRLDTLTQREQALRDGGLNDTAVVQMLASTLIAGTDRQRQPKSRAEAVEAFQSWRAYVRTKGTDPPPSARHNWPESRNVEQAIEYSTAMSYACDGRSIFMTAGRLGLGSGNTEAGDFVAILWGCPWPVVLRQLPGAMACVVVGAAYIDGAMQGEVVRKHEASGERDKVFELH